MISALFVIATNIEARLTDRTNMLDTLLLKTYFITDV
jgi:hypothetical protein